MTTTARPVPKPTPPGSRRNRQKPAPESAATEETRVTETQEPQTQEPPVEEPTPPAPQLVERSIAEIVGELESLAQEIAESELQIQDKRQRMGDLADELANAAAGPMAAVGLQIRVVPRSSVSSALPAPAPPARQRSSSASGSDDVMTPEKKREIREWLIRQRWVNPRTGNPLGEMGPIPQEGYAAYAAAH